MGQSPDMNKNTKPNDDVARVLATYSPEQQNDLTALRALIFEVAGETDGVGALEETLKWGQPSYLTSQTKSGTTIRIDKDGRPEGGIALYVSCNTNLVEQWRTQYPHLDFGGNRSMHFTSGVDLPKEELKHCIAMALTYHSRKKKS